MKAKVTLIIAMGIVVSNFATAKIISDRYYTKSNPNAAKKVATIGFRVKAPTEVKAKRFAATSDFAIRNTPVKRVA